jgi:TRAP-type transport system periplasmic protein
MKKLLILFVLVLFSTSIVFAIGEEGSQEDQKIVIRYGHSGTFEGLHGVASTKFKELAEKYSDGRIEVQRYPGNQLGSEQEAFQGARIGSPEMTDGAVNNLTPFAPSVGFCTFPYMFETKEQAYKILDMNSEIGIELREKVINEAGVRILGFLEGGFRMLTNSKRPVETMDDLKGLKIRVPNNAIMIDAWRQFGINPTATAWTETFTALQQKTVDGQENPPWVIWEENFNEVQKYITKMHYLMWLGPMVIGEDFYQSLPEDLKGVVNQAAAEAVDYEREVINKRNEEFLRELVEERGMIINELKDEDKWIAAAKEIWPKYYEDIGGKELVEKIEIIKSNM